MSKVENVISDEAVEAAAKAMHDLHKYGPRSLEGYMHDARAALEAAAPHIAERALDDAATALVEASAWSVEPSPWPDKIARWLRTRAAAIERSRG